MSCLIIYTGILVLTVTFKFGHKSEFYNMQKSKIKGVIRALGNLQDRRNGYILQSQITNITFLLKHL